MKGKKAKKILSIILALTLIVNLTGCKSGEDMLISYSLMQDPENLDPQTASDSGAIMVINNTFEGLYKMKTDGSCELGAASNLEMSEDELTLIFTIRDDLYWKYYTEDNKFKDGTSFDEKVTAKDYLYGLNRLFNPQNNTPFVSDYYFIKNAKEVKEGKLPMSSLGVTVLDDNKLKIELSHKNPMMQELFANAPAMPCNESFFLNTKGRYGMSGSMIVSNGPFYVDSWSTNEDNSYVRIRKNTKYHDKDSVKPLGINLTIRDKQTAYEAFKKTKIDTAIVTQSQREDLNISDDQAYPFKGSVLGIGFNQQKAEFKNDLIRKSFALDIDRDNLNAKLSKSDTLANAIVPPAVTIGKDSYRDSTDQNIALNYNKEQAVSLFNQGLSQLKKNDKKISNLNSLSILVNSSSTEALESILETWQKDLNVFLKVDLENEDQYNKKLKSGDFDCVLLSVESDSDSPSSVLSKFTQNSNYNYLSCDIKDIQNDIQTAAQQSDFNSMATIYLNAEKKIINSASFIPISYITEYFVAKKGIEGLQFNPGSRQIYFPYIKKK